ncbi:MAG TPA: hypothetical protein VLI39_00855 [Sedimentisphaerales bacterium]|nr:hypothetical protein [Sedimentisphaerales bacterium]
MATFGPQQLSTGLPVTIPSDNAFVPYPLLLTEGELIDLLRIPEVGGTASPHNVIENLKRMHNLPCIHICKMPLYPFEAVRQWILDKVEKERR